MYSQAMVICDPIENDAVVNESPTPRPRLLAVKNCCRPFSMMIDRPNVTISVVSSPLDRADWMTERCHQRYHDDEGQEHGNVRDGDDADRKIARQHGKVAVREVHDLHHAEHQRQPAGEQRVQPADQDPLDDGVYPGHYASFPSAGWVAAAAPARPK